MTDTPDQHEERCAGKAGVVSGGDNKQLETQRNECREHREKALQQQIQNSSPRSEVF